MARRMARAVRRWLVSRKSGSSSCRNSGGPRHRASTLGGVRGMPRGDALPSSPRTGACSCSPE
eukprot:4281417-Alexandrium_andersonii.AAC.1